MNLESQKIELAKLILSLESASLIEKLKQLIINEISSSEVNLSEIEKRELELGIAQLDAGEKISLEEFLKKVS